MLALIKETDGFNGADLEAVVKDTIELAFIEGRSAITTDDSIKTVKDTKSISSTLKEKIKEMKRLILSLQVKRIRNHNNVWSCTLWKKNIQMSCYLMRKMVLSL